MRSSTVLCDTPKTAAPFSNLQKGTFKIIFYNLPLSNSRVSTSYLHLKKAAACVFVRKLVTHFAFERLGGKCPQKEDPGVKQVKSSKHRSLSL